MDMAMQEFLDGKSHPVIAATARDMLDRPEEEAGSVLSTAKSYLSLYRDPIVANNISDSDFKIRDLMHHENPVSLYIVSHPNDKSRLRPLIRILINMIIRKLADRITFKDGQPAAHYQHKLLLMLDEFPSLGKLEIFQESLAFIAGYGMKAYLICQDLNQLKSRETGYGHDEAITSNCHIQTCFRNRLRPSRMEKSQPYPKLETRRRRHEPSSLRRCDRCERVRLRAETCRRTRFAAGCRSEIQRCAFAPRQPLPDLRR